jgi:hypothetical protein
MACVQVLCVDPIVSSSHKFTVINSFCELNLCTTGSPFLNFRDQPVPFPNLVLTSGNRISFKQVLDPMYVRSASCKASTENRNMDVHNSSMPQKE